MIHFQSSGGGCKTKYWTQPNHSPSSLCHFRENLGCVAWGKSPHLPGLVSTAIKWEVRTRWSCHSMRLENTPFQLQTLCPLLSHIPSLQQMGTLWHYLRGPLLLEVRAKDVKLLEIFKSWKQSFHERGWNTSSFQYVFLGPCTGLKTLWLV